MKHTVETYSRDLEAELTFILDLMQQHWCIRPKLAIKVIAGLVVDCEYDRQWKRTLKRRLYIDPARISTSRKPLNLARNLARSYKGNVKFVYDRKNTDPMPVEAGLYQKMLAVELQRVGVSYNHLSVEPALVVSVDFNIEGFAHKGQRVWVTATNENTYKKPALIARQFAAEISDHRNTCKECGIGVAPLIYRAKGWYEQYPQMGSRPLPDAVEQYLHPRLAKEARERMTKEGIYESSTG